MKRNYSTRKSNVKSNVIKSEEEVNKNESSSYMHLRKKRKLKDNVSKDELTNYVNEDIIPSDEVKENSVTSKRNGKLEDSLRVQGHVCDLPEKNNKSITCAVCKVEMLNQDWLSHKLKDHNNLTWKVGEPPLDLEDRSLVISILTSLYKQKQKFKCETCSAVKKSVMGFLSHKSSCNKSKSEIEMVKIKCELCNKKILPVSMSSHMRFVHSPKTNVIIPEENVKIPKKRQSAMRVSNMLKAIRDAEESQEDGFETKNDSAKKKKVLLVNFNFQPTFALKKHLVKELAKNSKLKCKFDGCNFESDMVKDVLKHLPNCQKRITLNSTCKFCFKPFNDCKRAERHAKGCEELQLDEDVSFESNFVTLDELVTSNESPNSIKKTSVVNGNRKYQIDLPYFIPKQTNTTKICYSPIFDWMMKFFKEHYSNSDLYKEFIQMPHNWMVLEPKNIINYLPMNKVSIETSRIVDSQFINPQLRSDVPFRRFKLFESEIFDNGSSMVFCGGSISSMAWAPTPTTENNCDQIIVVATNLNPNKEPILTSRYNDKGLLQFWNFRALTNKDISKYKPKLEFCIVHDYGYVYDMEWCPSGCYNSNRLGLLAIACSNFYVCVYSICQPPTLNGKIFKPKPVLKLVLSVLDELNIGEHNYHATKISWTKAKEHKYIAVGYSNGIVGIYDITKETYLKKDGVATIQPIQTIFAHVHAITALSLYHLDDGRRWLMTGSTDRLNKFWDLRDSSEPISCHRKGNITDGVWPVNWIGGITCQDDGVVTIINSSTYGQAREVGVNASAILYANSTINSVTASNWGNIFVHGTCNGEIHASYPNQIFQNVDLEKSVKTKKFYVAHTTLIEKELSLEERINLENKKEETFNPEVSKERFKKSDVFKVETHLLQEPLNYYDTDKQYKLLFVDMNLDSSMFITDEHVKSVGFKSKLLKPSRPNQYPIQSVKKVSLNPNRQAFLYLGSGYQAGFLKVACLRFLNDS